MVPSLQRRNQHRHMVITQSPQFTWGFTLFLNKCFFVLSYLFIYLAVLGLKLWHAGSSILVVACKVFSCVMWDLVPWLVIKSIPSALGAWSLNHWNAKAVPRFHPCYVVYPTDLDKCIMACHHLYNNTQRNFSAIQVFCALPIHPSLPYVCFLSVYHEYFLCP